MRNVSSIVFRCGLVLWLAIRVLSFGSDAKGDESQVDEAVVNSNWVSAQGRYLRLVTDLPNSDHLRDWVTAFDAAVPLWAAYWNHDVASLNDWRVTAYVMSDKAPFLASGALPRSLPDFRHGYQVGNRIWVLHQPTQYYTRHLLLHEGSHAITSHLLGGSGPPWYMEGTAEWLATHSWRPARTDGTAAAIEIGIVPPFHDAARGWGRIDLIDAGRKNKRVPTIETVMRYSDTAHRDIEPYAWSWLAVAMMEMYPEYRKVLRSAASNANDRSPQFNRDFYAKIREQWPVLAARWQLFAHDMEYDWDPARHQINLPTSLLPLRDQASMTVVADHGWQSAPVMLRTGQTVEITAQGRFVIRRTGPLDELDNINSASPLGDQPPVSRNWESEAAGVTIRYHRGRPIGQLVAQVVPMSSGETGPYLDAPNQVAIGASGRITATRDSWLLLKINEPAGQYGDNSGALQVQIVALP